MSEARASTIEIEGDALRRLREAWGLDQSEFAELLGVRREWVSRKETGGRTTMRFTQVKHLAAATLLTTHDAVLLLTRLTLEVDGTRRHGRKLPGVISIPPLNSSTEQKGPGMHETSVLSGSRVQLREVPFFDVRISAGGWTDTVDALNFDDADGVVPVPSDAPRDAFALRISGDCMEPEIANGSIIIFAPLDAGSMMRSFEPGKLYYVQTTDDRATFKRVSWDAKVRAYRLECVNPKYEALLLPEQELARLSRAIKLVRDLI